MSFPIIHLPRTHQKTNNFWKHRKYYMQKHELYISPAFVNRNLLAQRVVTSNAM